MVLSCSLVIHSAFCKLTVPEKENLKPMVIGRVTGNWSPEQTIWFIIISVAKNNKQNNNTFKSL